MINSFSEYMVKETFFKKVNDAVIRLIIWLDRYGETSQDQQDFFANYIGRKAKAYYYKRKLLGTIAVSPFICCEVFLPLTRFLFWKKQRLPISDAHYAMGFGLLSKLCNKEIYYRRAVHFLEVLLETRCKEYENMCWGYPFDWVTITGIIKKGTPLITTTPYVYEAFEEVFEIDKDDKWLKIMRSIAEHAFWDIKDYDFSKKSKTCSYTPFDKGGVVNASSYRAFLLTNAAIRFSEERYWKVAEKNLNFVLECQGENGSWPYARDGIRKFVDHFHTCFILKNLVKIYKFTGHKETGKAIENGINYYVRELFDQKGLPKPFAIKPRLIIYRRELYDYAECINLGALLEGHFSDLDRLVERTLDDLLNNWQRPDGSFRSREMLVGWDNVPMHRWGQSQIFRSLSLMLYKWSNEKDGGLD